MSQMVGSWEGNLWQIQTTTDTLWIPYREDVHQHKTSVSFQRAKRPCGSASIHGLPSCALAGRSVPAYVRFGPLLERIGLLYGGGSNCWHSRLNRVGHATTSRRLIPCR
jgi:hypothetical protein